MEKFIFFGIGNQCKKILEKYPYAIEHIAAFTQNQMGEMNSFADRPLISPKEAAKSGLDIVITPVNYRMEIANQCVNELGISPKRLIPYEEFIYKMIQDDLLLPYRVNLNVSSLCQLDCRGCDRVATYKRIGAGYLAFENFKHFLDENSFVKCIEISGNGEPFLNPEIREILEYAQKKGVEITCDYGTNFNAVSEEVLEAIVKTSVRSMAIALDGASQETYSQYRRNGKFDLVIDNIKKINWYKEKHQTDYPKLIWQFVLMESDELDAQRAKDMANELRMQIVYKLNWDRMYRPKNVEFLHSVTGLKYLTRDEYEGESGDIYRNACHMLWDQPTINWDGRLLGCCRSYAGFGVNVFEVGLKEALVFERYMDAKRAVLGKKVLYDYDIPCAKCSYYQKMIKGNQYAKIERI